MTVKFWIVQVAVLVSLFVVWNLGWVDILVQGDPTGLTLWIAATGVVGIIAQVLGWWSISDHIVEHVIKFGLFGTLVGMGIVARHSGGDFDILLGGLGTAFYTTIMGLLVEQWLILSQKLR